MPSADWTLRSSGHRYFDGCVVVVLRVGGETDKSDLREGAASGAGDLPVLHPRGLVEQGRPQQGEQARG